MQPLLVDGHHARKNTQYEKNHLFFMVLLVLISCTKNSEEKQLKLLTGIWEKTQILENDNLSQSLRYRYNSDHTFMVSRVIIDNATTDVIGYRYRALGTFTIRKDILTMHYLEVYNHTDLSGLFSGINDLELTTNTKLELLNYSIDKKKNRLTFTYPPCGPTENCIASQIFQKRN